MKTNPIELVQVHTNTDTLTPAERRSIERAVRLHAHLGELIGVCRSPQFLAQTKRARSATIRQIEALSIGEGITIDKLGHF